MLLGKEIEVFFCEYGEYGFFGIIISASIIGSISYKIFSICKNSNIRNYEQFLNEIIKNKNEYASKIKKQKIIKMSIKYIINIFLLISFFIMVAGFGSYFKQQLGISEIYGAIIIAILCYNTFNRNIEGVTRINTILVPLLIISILFLGMKFELNIQINNYQSSNINWLSSSILYASYNSILLIPILISLSINVKNKKNNLSICIISTMIIAALANILYNILMLYKYEISLKEIPMLYIAGKLGMIYQYLYGFIILVSIFTSAVSAGHGFLEGIENNEKRKRINFMICVISVLVSKIGFSYMVNLLYPILGLIGLLQIGVILMYKNT